MEEVVRDAHGLPIAYIRHSPNQITVYSEDRRLLGWCTNGNTYDASNRRIAEGENPHLLVGR